MNRLENLARRVRDHLTHHPSHIPRPIRQDLANHYPSHIPRPIRRDTISRSPASQPPGERSFVMDQSDVFMEEHAADLKVFMAKIKRQHNVHMIEIPAISADEAIKLEALIAKVDNSAVERASKVIIIVQANDNDNNAIVQTTRPSSALLHEFRCLVNAPELEELYLPFNISTWSLALLSLWNTTKHRKFMLGCARFGQAQVVGAPEEMMRMALEEIRSFRYRSHENWMALMQQGRICVVEMEEGYEAKMIPVYELFEDGEEEEQHIDEVDFVRLAFHQLSYGHRWLWPKILDRITNNSAGREVIRDRGEDRQCCSICLEPYALAKDHITYAAKRYFEKKSIHNDHAKIMTHCRHQFGFSCLSRWARYSINCPICRRDLATPDEPGQLAPENVGAVKVNIDVFRAAAVVWDRTMHDKVMMCQVTGKWELAQMLISNQVRNLLLIEERLRVEPEDQVLQGEELAGSTRAMEEDWQFLAFNLSRQLRGLRNKTHQFAETEAIEFHLNLLTEAFLKAYLS